MRIIRAKDYREMSRRAAEIIASEGILKPEWVLGMATGSRTVGTYDELVKMYEDGALDFSEVRTASLDE